VLGLLTAYPNPAALPAAVPFLTAWFLSPALAYWVSRPRAEAEPPLTADERRLLRRLARKTWLFFETFVGPDDHWLPPDNFQEDPGGKVAHRTSPTNMGLYLLSCLAAHDLGYLSLPALADRLEKTFDTFDRLERFHGHFYNWYDTLTLKVLPPGYISTVDSGNLLGCLVALGQGLREKADASLCGPAVREGLADTLGLVAEALDRLTPPGEPPPDQPVPPDPLRLLARTVGELERILQESPGDLVSWDHWLERLEHRADELVSQAQDLVGALGESPEELQRWVRRFAEQVRDHRGELNGLAPWLRRLSAVGRRLSGRQAAKPRWAKEPDPSLQRWQDLLRGLRVPIRLGELRARAETITAELAALEEQAAGDGQAPQGDSGAARLADRLQQLADRAGAFARAIDFKILYNEQRHLFSIGYNRMLGRLDNAHYDLLASEASLASFLAIARGDVPRRHWFQLGRQLTRTAGGVALVSWGGTMFEYLMPRLLLRTYPGTLLEESWRTAVDRQIEYGRQNRVPWGISESGFNALDANLDYQYQSFGVPGLGLKRGLSRDLVIAPYATALALVIRPHAAVENFRALAAEKAEGPFGFYEAIDYTRDRLLEKRRSAVVRSYMAHHQGMTLVALTNCLLSDPMPRRFHREPMVRATELLLQERVPLAASTLAPHDDEAAPPPVVREGLLPMSRRLTTPDTPHPRTHLLSNGQYTVMLTNAGGGFSTCNGLDVTRWREDRTADAYGQFVYVHDLRSGLVWSAGHQPVCRPADDYEVVYSTDKAEFRRSDNGIDTLLEVCVTPENSAEVRRITLTNNRRRTRELELTSYAEVVLTPHAADLAHPAFHKLFLETEFFAPEDALLCRRRPRSAEQKPVWAVHVVAVDGLTVGPVQYETDRARFLGRGRTPARPAALDPGAALSGTTGPVLDPIFSLRRRMRVGPGESVVVAFTTAVAATREEALALADQYHDLHGVNRAFELAWAHSQVQHRHLHLSTEEAHLYQRLAAHVLYAGRVLRAPQSVLTANRQGQPGLWKHGISGDRPIVLARVAEPEELNLVRQLLVAHTYWRLRGLEVDLVLLNEHPTGYFEELQQQLQGLVRASESHALADKPGGVFLRRVGHLSDDDLVLLQSAARVVLSGDRGSLAAQVDQRERFVPLPERLVPSERARDRETRRQGDKETSAELPARESLLFFNGHGGFTPDGREYVVRLRQQADRADRREAVSAFPGLPVSLSRALPPAPWINVIANAQAGFLISEAGGGYTWAGNSQLNRLTPWSNDPVSDPPGEVIYLRDEATGEFWTPTPLPRGAADVRVRHGQGYTVFEQDSHGLRQELLLFMPPDDPVKLIRLRVRNQGQRPRRLAAVFYAEWVLGTVRDQAAMNVVTEFDPESEAILARNPFNADFAGQLAFAATTLRPLQFTADRTEFLGRNGSTADPAALGRVGLSGTTGAALDPCAALMGTFLLQPGEEKEVIFCLGQAPRLEEVRRLLRRYRQPGQVQEALAQARGRWDRILGAVQVRTPDPAMDLLLNRWLVYQVLSCRLWGRSAFYQSGGAYGFRDQLQDVMALVYGFPEEARAHLLRAAGRQFLEGDVQHWWHPPAGRGVRTRFSDDFLWLPLVVHHYVTTTGDYGVLDEPVPFLRAPPLRPEQEEDYGLPEVTDVTAPLYEHCVRAIANGCRYGAHGLPLMGIGDWNDGMNKVGAHGKGESVWNAWFQITILRRFAELADRRGDGERARQFREQAERLRAAVEEHAWDGGWYRRAYFDDGTPLGSAQNDECKIDSIAQTWAVISGAADPERARQAMAAVDELLVRPADRLILLFTPPFDKGALQPGYIKGYVPGIRENGGQYTHAATWVVQAMALLGRGNRAGELFDLLNPIRHAATAEDAARYKVEPYVVAADIYGAPPHVGRGGWTWYTGSAGWLFRVGLESILGFQLRGDTLRIDPCIPARWPGFEIAYRHRTATYHIVVENPHGVEHGVKEVVVDGTIREDGLIPLADDGRGHEVRVVLG
ncbi:MAG TPA: glucoamylase family protein, partial [Gemmataceae bacterium]|nr:glucoamylase family protein [Gemmataceae bacterium]